jgi:hypothetical protein
LYMIFIIACTSQGNKQNQAGQESTETAAEPSSDEHGSAQTVQLNNGAKWQANPETTQGIAAMQQLVSSFSKTPATEDYKQLKEKLETEFKTIFQKCTMTGEAHTQLHNYLLPLKEMIEDLGSNNPDESKKALNEIQMHLTKYSMYFA